MADLEKLETLLRENQMLSFKKFDDETIVEMLDSRENEDFENDWLRVFREIELREKLKPLTSENLAKIEKIREISYKKTFDSTRRHHREWEEGV